MFLLEFQGTSNFATCMNVEYLMCMSVYIDINE